VKFWQACKKKKDKDEKPIVFDTIKPILGIEAYLCRNRKSSNPDRRKGNRHLILLAKNAEGYKNLCRLSQKSWLEGQYIDPRIDFELLAQHNQGLICSSACLSGVVNANLLRGRYEQAKKAATILKDIFKEDFFLEVMFHGLDEERVIIPEVIKMGQELDVPVIASNDNHYLKKEQARSQELLMAMSTSRCLKDPKRLRFPYDEFYMKSAEEMSLIFGNHPELLLNTVAVSERIEDFFKGGGMRMPKFPIKETIEEKKLQHLFPPNINYNKITAQQFLEKLAWEGMKKLKWDTSEAHIKALNKELGDVKVAFENNGMDFATYFLIVWDYVNYAN
jgi:DNA polymerase-3 subunit alpha